MRQRLTQLSPLDRSQPLGGEGAYTPTAVVQDGHSSSTDSTRQHSLTRINNHPPDQPSDPSDLHARLKQQNNHAVRTYGWLAGCKRDARCSSSCSTASGCHASQDPSRQRVLRFAGARHMHMQTPEHAPPTNPPSTCLRTLGATNVHPCSGTRDGMRRKRGSRPSARHPGCFLISS